VMTAYGAWVAAREDSQKGMLSLAGLN